MVTACIFFTVKTSLGFVETPIITSYVTKLFHNKTMPEIAVCFNGGLNASALMKKNFSDELILRVSDTKLANHNDSVMNELENFLFDNNLKMPDFITKFGYTCEDMLSRKFQAGDLSSTNIGCQGVTYFPSSVYGLCMLFKNNGYQYWPDLDGGVKLHLTVPPMSVSEVKPDLVHETDRSITFLLTVSERFDFSMVKSKFILPNMKTEIILSPVHYVRLPNGGNCESGQIYLSTNDCFQKCYSDSVYESCGCVPLKYYSIVDDADKITCNLDQVQCSNYSESKTVECENNCTPLCDEWIYDITLSASPFLSKNGSKSIVWIGFNQMQYTQVNERDISLNYIKNFT